MGSGGPSPPEQARDGERHHDACNAEGAARQILHARASGSRCYCTTGYGAVARSREAVVVVVQRRGPRKRLRLLGIGQRGAASGQPAEERLGAGECGIHVSRRRRAIQHVELGGHVLVRQDVERIALGRRLPHLVPRRTAS